MTTTQTAGSTGRRPLRLWPGVVLAGIVAVGKFLVPLLGPDYGLYGFLGAAVGSLLVLLWWLFASRAPWLERLGALALMVLAIVAIRPLLDKSIAGGAMGMLFYVLAVPWLAMAFVAWAVATRHLSDGVRRVTMAVTIVLACGAWTLIRTGGFDSSFHNDFAWRWSKTREERLLAAETGKPLPPVTTAPPPLAAPSVAPAAAPSALPSAPPPSIVAAPEPLAADAGATAAAPARTASSDTDWPGFRGPGRDGIVRGSRIRTDWSASPPVELWRREVGPGWSSFAVRGDILYTQEQRGDEEVVASYRVATGEPIWRHRDAARFWESNAGAGPRGTPTLAGGRVYTLGGTGIVNALDARDGTVAWTRNAAADTGAKVPYWGFSGSPLVVGDLVVVAASGALAAYDTTTGQPRWKLPVAGEGYSSPQLVTIGNVAQILLLSGTGMRSVAPGDGALLWDHAWKGYPIVQPALTPDGDVLMSVSESSGLRRLGVARGPSGWTATERWTSNGLKPYFNDFVVHRGHAFGFDGRLLACVDLADGQRKWKGGRYGQGQLVLLPDQDLLLVLSEEGELALVGATPDGFNEIARSSAIQGKTWNHPVLVGDTLLVRNSEEMAAFRLALADR
jgi:outer membrane protein assembly factor BamB